MTVTTDTTDNSAAELNGGWETSTVPVPGKVYLRRPTGSPTLPRDLTDVLPSDGGTAVLLVGGPGSADSRRAATREIGRLLSAWLEAFDGRRPVAALRRGPYSPGVVDDLRRQIRTTVEQRSGTPSRLLRVHLPPSRRGRLSFTASAAVDGRVRALVGHLARYEARWRVESVTLL